MPIPFAQARFPKPEFTGGYAIPDMGLELGVFDGAGWRVILSALALALAAYALRRRRSRKLLMGLAFANAAVFGFWLRGCLCSPGAMQPVAAALFNSGAFLPLSVLLIFLLPLAAAMYAGRVFCLAGCPLGAAQELLQFKNIPLPRRLDAALGFLPFFTLAAVLSAAASGLGYWLCRHDPYIVLYRAAGSGAAFVCAVSLLFVNAFVPRAFCRFLCPYGVLLHFAAVLSPRAPKITLESCVNCNLCPSACAARAIEDPAPVLSAEAYAKGLRRMRGLLGLWPFGAVVFGLTGWLLGALAVPAHPDARLLDDARNRPESVDASAFLASDQPVAALERRVAALGKTMPAAWALCWSFAGLLAGWELVRQSRLRRNTEHRIDPARCLACGRCFDACPLNRKPLPKADCDG